MLKQYMLKIYLSFLFLVLLGFVAIEGVVWGVGSTKNYVDQYEKAGNVREANIQREKPLLPGLSEEAFELQEKREKAFNNEDIEAYQRYTLRLFSVCLETNNKACIENLVEDTFFIKPNLAERHLFLQNLFRIVEDKIESLNVEASLFLLDSVQYYTENNSQKAEIHNLRGWILHEKGYFRLAAESFHKALDFLQSDEYKRISSVYTSLGAINHSIADYKGALNLYRKALKYAERVNNEDEKLAVSQIESNMAISYMRLGQFDKALDSHIRVLNYAIQANNSTLTARSLYNIGNLHLTNSNLQESEQFFEKSLNMSRENGLVFGEMASLLGLGLVYKKNKEYERSENYLKKSLSIARDKGIVSVEMEILGPLTEIYEITGMTEKMNEYAVVYKNLSDSLGLISEREEAFMVQSEFERELQQKELALKEEQLREANSAFILTVIILMVLTLGFTGGMIYLFGRKNNDVKEENYPNKLPVSHTNRLSAFESMNKNNSLLHVTSNEEGQEINDEKNLFQRIIYLFEEEHIYRDAGLSLTILADRVNSNRKYVSEVINQVTGMNYYEFVNSYRIKSAKDILNNNLKNKPSLKRVMRDSGYKNTSTFYRAFKENTGKTPGEYVEESLSQSQIKQS